MPLQKTGSLPPETAGLPSCSFFSWTWQPSLTSKDSSQWTAGGQSITKFVVAVDVPYFLHTKPLHHFSRFSWKWKMAFFWLYLKGKDPIGGTIFFHFDEGVFQVSKTYLSRCVPGMSHEWVPFPTKDVSCWSKGCGNLHFKISYEPSQFFQLQEISPKCTISITQRINGINSYLRLVDFYIVFWRKHQLGGGNSNIF